MTSFESLCVKIEQAVNRCLDSQEPLEESIKKCLVPFANANKEIVDLRKATLEHVFKKLSARISTYPPDRLIPAAFRLLNLVLGCHEAESFLCEQAITLTILEELMETQPLEVCEKLYSFLEINKKRLLVNLIPTQGKGLILLRLSNELIRRASKSNHNAFRGRILIFLSNTYALGEVSGVNKGGECNVDNVTHYSASQDGEEAAFYNTFWGLQAYFSNPPKLFKDNNLEVVLNNIGIVLNRFADIISREKLKTAEENLGGNRNNDFEFGLPSPPSDDGCGKKRKFVEIEEEESVSFSKDYVKYFPKYLSSFALFDKEISDPNFRRIVLVQILIIMQYLTGFFPEEQARINKAKAPHDAAAVQLPTYTIMEPQQHMIQELWNKIIRQLEETTTNGKNFVRTILHILNMEKRWNYWKFADNCSFGSEKVMKDRAERAREDFAEALKRKAKMSRPMEPLDNRMGTLSEFWTRDDNDEEFLSDTSRKIIAPKFQTVYERIKQDGYPPEIGFILDSSDTVEEKELKEKCWVNKWFALRTARHHYLLHFNKPVKKDAKLKKEDEEKKDDVETLKMLIDENPTCSSATVMKK
ncbi:THO complex, subunit THOC1 [Gigaspora rosea]|uniref:THO complex, subunit THOC1 n=1 Tax=Gigaspora rosea TaxID=44941 RepID=A0A397ULL2_9GLOM|nr:THO complex, subunit THOC1 [Gigaspora rosea]